MKRIAIIPARSGSKGIVNKNLTVVGGLTLLERAVKAAVLSEVFDHIFVSTDSKAYQELAINIGAECPTLRSASASSSSATSESVVLEVLNYFDSICTTFTTYALLEPSSPLRPTNIIREAVLQAEKYPYTSCCTVSEVPSKYHPFKQIALSNENFAKGFSYSSKPLQSLPRQKLTKSFIRNGVIYAGLVDTFVRELSIITSNSRLIRCDYQTFNIDSHADLMRAQAFFDKYDEKNIQALFNDHYTVL